MKASALNGSTIDFAAFKGKKILIVNTTAEADNNPQYAQLEALYQKYKDKLVIVAFLDEDFATPPGSKKGQFANVERHYNVSFPVAAKILVRGDDMPVIYKWLTEKKYNGFMDSEVKWDFQKYLINEKGELVNVFDPNVKAYNPAVIAAIEK
jgi:glutathione peroxidase